MKRLVSGLRSALRGGHDASLLGSLLLGLSVKGISTLATFSIAVVLARGLGPTGYGTYVFSLTLVALIALPLQSGLSQLVVRETARLALPRDMGHFEQLLSWARRRVLIILAVVLVVSAGFWLMAGRPALTDPANRESVLAAGLLLIVTIPFTAIPSSALRGLGLGNLGQVPDLLIRHCSFLALLTIASALLANGADGGALNPMLVMGLHVAGSAIAFCMATLFLRRARARVDLDAAFEAEEPKTNTTTAAAPKTTELPGPKFWQAASWALLSVAGLQLLNASIDMLALGWLRGDTEVGLYRVLVQMSTLVAFGLIAINPVIHGRFAKLYAKGEMAALQRLVSRAVLLSLVMAALPMLVLFAYGSPVLTWFFGTEYAAHGVTLRIILLGQLANVAFGAVAALLNMTGHQSDTVGGMLIAVALNLVLNLTLIPIWGIMGAATATALSTALWNALLWHMVWKRLGIDSSILGAGWRRHLRKP